MARVYCIQWWENDEGQGVRNVGWSFHLSLPKAAAYIASHKERYGLHEDPRCVDVPIEVWKSVNARREGMFWATPLPCPFPTVSDGDVEVRRDVSVESALAVPEKGVQPAHLARDTRALRGTESH